jgi:hypothetical protein
MFVSPNLAAIMNSVPAQHRGVSSGMRSTFSNTANTVSLTWIFAIVTIGLAAHLPSALYQGLTQAGVPASAAQQVANIPPTGALFAAFLGYDPMQSMLPASVIQQLPANSQALLFNKTFFPNLISAPFDDGLRVAFEISIGFSLVASLASLLMGKRFIYEQERQPQLNLGLAADPPDPGDSTVDPPEIDELKDERELAQEKYKPGG